MSSALYDLSMPGTQQQRALRNQPSPGAAFPIPPAKPTGGGGCPCCCNAVSRTTARSTPATLICAEQSLVTNQGTSAGLPALHGPRCPTTSDLMIDCPIL